MTAADLKIAAAGTVDSDDSSAGLSDSAVDVSTPTPGVSSVARLPTTSAMATNTSHPTPPVSTCVACVSTESKTISRTSSSLTGNGASTQVRLTGLPASNLPSTLTGNNNNNTSVLYVVNVPASSGGSTATSSNNNSTNDKEDVPSGPTSATDKRQDNSDKDDEEDSYEDVIRACWC